MTSSPPTRWQPGRRPVLVPDLGSQLLAPLAVLEELLTDLAVWEDEDLTDPFRARQVLWLPAPLGGRVAVGALLGPAGRLSWGAVWRWRALPTPSRFLGPPRGRLPVPEVNECPPLSAVVLAAGD